MHEITTTKTIADATEVEVITYDFDNQEEVLAFLADFASLEADLLYANLKAQGDRTTVLIEPSPHRSMRRVVSGTTRRDGVRPIEGTVTIEARRVA